MNEQTKPSAEEFLKEKLLNAPKIEGIRPMTEAEWEHPDGIESRNFLIQIIEEYRSLSLSKLKQENEALREEVKIANDQIIYLNQRLSGTNKF